MTNQGPLRVLQSSGKSFIYCLIQGNQELLVTADLTYHTHGKLTSEGKTTHIIGRGQSEKLCQAAVKKVKTINCIQLRAEMSKQYKKNTLPFKYAIDNFSVLTILNCMVLTEHQGARCVLVFCGFKKYIYGKYATLASSSQPYRKIKRRKSWQLSFCITLYTLSFVYQRELDPLANESSAMLHLFFLKRVEPQALNQIVQYTIFKVVGVYFQFANYLIQSSAVMRWESGDR